MATDGGDEGVAAAYGWATYFFVAVQVVVCVVDGIICDVFWPKGRAISNFNRIFAV